MGSGSKSVGSLAVGGVLITLMLVAGCDFPDSARARHELPRSVPAETASATSANTAMADAASHPVVPVAGDTLCEAGETPFFSCAIGTKRVSVCGGGAGAAYRYGTSDTVELTARSLTFASEAYSGGGEAQISASNGDYTYTVYDRTVRTSFGPGGNDPEFSSGLVISRGKRLISSRMCKGGSSGDADAARALPAGRFVEH